VLTATTGNAYPQEKGEENAPFEFYAKKSIDFKYSASTIFNSAPASIKSLMHAP
jgi:hypothetical protein